MNVFDETSFVKIKEIPAGRKLKEDNYFSFELKNVLVIRSYTPSIKPVMELLKSEFPECMFDILQVKGARNIQMLEQTDLKNIFETPSKKGFRIRNIFRNYKLFSNKPYDAVIALYGSDLYNAMYYNVDLYAYFIPARFHLGYGTDGHFRIITAKSIMTGMFPFIYRYFIYLINVAATLFLFVYTSVWFLVLSPLAILHKKSSKNLKRSL